MFHHLVHEAEELVHEAVHEAEELVEEAVEEAEELVKEAEETMQEAETTALKGMTTLSKGLSQGLEEGNISSYESMKNIERSLAGEPPEKAKGHWIVDSMWFNVSVTMMTLLNTLQMGLEADHPDWTLVWLVCENVFTAGFTLEMVVKFCVFKCKYFTDMANWLDGSLTTIAILDCWVMTALGGGIGLDLQSLSVLRILRLLRFARILKLMRSVKPLVLVVQGIIKAMSTAVYVFVLCIFVFYVFAIFVTEHLGRPDTTLYPGYTASPEEIDEQSFMLNYNPYICFGSMMSSMITLFNMAVLAEWIEIVRPIAIKQPWFLPIFLFFATCVGFGVMNVLIGVIVDVVMSESKRIEKEYKDQVRKEKLATLAKIQALLQDIDDNGDGIIDLIELAQAMTGNEELKQLMANINLPRGWSSDELLHMLDNDGDGVLQYPEFTASFFRLIDCDHFHQICIVQASINEVKHLIRDQNQHFGTSLVALEAGIDSVKRHLGIVEEILTQDDCQVRTAAKVKGTSAGFCGKPCSKEQPASPLPKDVKKQQGGPGSKGGKEQQGSPSSKEHVLITESANEELPTSTCLASQEPIRESALINGMQFREVLDAALLAVKDHVHEEFVAFRNYFETEHLTCSRPECKAFGLHSCSSVVEDVGPQSPCCPSPPVGLLELAANCPQPTGNRSTNGFKSEVLECKASKLGSGMDNWPVDLKSRDLDIVTALHRDVAFACELLASVPPEVSSAVEHEDGEHPGNQEFSTVSAAPQPDVLPADLGCADVAPQLPDANPKNATYDFVFEDAQPLGFTVQWVKDGLPLVGEVKIGGAANLQGVLQGDKLAECNGTCLAAKDRQEILQLLGVRPLKLTFFPKAHAI